MILEDFAGPGGWDEGAVIAGYTGRLVGLEWDRAACLTAVAAGHTRIRTDVATYPSDPFIDRVDGYIASPPCQAWSMAGKRDGEKDREQCHQLASLWADGEPSPFLDDEWADIRSQLVCEPVRRVRDLRPRWVALEQVPPVLGLWQHFARIFRHWGYSVWAGVLSAEAYGVPQTRKRAILIARRDGVTANPPAATHQTWPANDEPDLFGDALPAPLSMAEALGWGMTGRPSVTVTAVSSDSAGGPRPLGGGSGAREMIRKERDAGRWVPPEYLRMGTHAAATVRAVDEPAPTVFFGERVNGVTWHTDNPRELSLMSAGKTGEGRPRDAATAPAATITGKGTAAWVFDRPSTTVCADPRIGRPGHKDREGGESQFERDSYPITVQEAAVLQSFRLDYPWQGSKTKQHECIGNAIPPLLAAAILRPLLNVPTDRRTNHVG